jgi:hypothetical protein
MDSWNTGVPAVLGGAAARDATIRSRSKVRGSGGGELPTRASSRRSSDRGIGILDRYLLLSGAAGTLFDSIGLDCFASYSTRTGANRICPATLDTHGSRASNPVADLAPLAGPMGRHFFFTSPRDHT